MLFLISCGNHVQEIIVNSHHRWWPVGDNVNTHCEIMEMMARHYIQGIQFQFLAIVDNENYFHRWQTTIYTKLPALMSVKVYFFIRTAATTMPTMDINAHVSCAFVRSFEYNAIALHGMLLFLLLFCFKFIIIFISCRSAKPDCYFDLSFKVTTFLLVRKITLRSL